MNTDTYEVKFWIKKKDGFWTQTTKVYKAGGKNKHHYVRGVWEKEYKKQSVRLVSIVYQ